MTWKQVLPELARLDDPATHELFSQAQEVSLPANTIVYHLQRGCIDLQDTDGLKKLATQ